MSVLMTRRMHHSFGLLNKKYSKRYFTIKNVRDNSFYLYLSWCNTFEILKYRINNGGWNPIDTTKTIAIISLQGLESIEFSGEKKNNSTSNFMIGCVKDLNGRIPADNPLDHEIHVKGNIMSLIYGDDFLNDLNKSTIPNGVDMSNLFTNIQILTDASKLILPATTLAESCYRSMFQGCTNLINPPKVLPAEYGPRECYSYMFSGCTQLIKTPLICMTDGYNNNGTGWGRQCSSMFADCVNLTKAEIWFAISGIGWGASRPGAATDDMFSGCSGLHELYLYAPKLTQNCYNSILGSNPQFSQTLLVYIYAKEADTPDLSVDTIWTRYFDDSGNTINPDGWPISGINIYMLENTNTDADTDESRFLTALENTFSFYRPRYIVDDTYSLQYDDSIYTPPTVDLDTGEPISI